MGDLHNIPEEQRPYYLEDRFWFASAVVLKRTRSSTLFFLECNITEG
jgi:hypothetical protein